MEDKGKIAQYRERLDKTLGSVELKNEKILKTLVKDQLLRSSQHENEGLSENVLEKRTMELVNFLDMLRSTSVNDHEILKSSEASRGEWKMKHDNEEFRVMYREGPPGTPFHTLLVEGYVDGPIDVCLCISWEAALYKKWWPQSSFPPFKVTMCERLQEVRINEQIALIRVKVAWPLSAREAVVHYFLFEFFQDDLIVILVNTVSDVSSIDKKTHGFTSDGIPETKDVRIDLVGGFALQKVTAERSYFRTIANMDIKLDFAPPSLINFISRQLIGNGFRLYQKTVAAVSNRDEDYSKALGDALYTRIREALYADSKLVKAVEEDEPQREACVLAGEQPIGDVQDDMNDTEQEVHNHDQTTEMSAKNTQDRKRKAFGEIEEEEEEEEEEESEKSTYLDKNDEVEDQPSTDFAHKHDEDFKKNIHVSPEVEKALGTLEKVISVIRENGFKSKSRSPSSSPDEEPLGLRKDAEMDFTSAAHAAISLKSLDISEIPKKEVMERKSHDSRNSTGIYEMRSAGSNSFSREANLNKVAPASPREDSSSPESAQVAITPSADGGAAEANGIHENSLERVKKLNSWQRRHRFCCFGFNL